MNVKKVIDSAQAPAKYQGKASTSTHSNSCPQKGKEKECTPPAGWKEQRSNHTKKGGFGKGKVPMKNQETVKPAWKVARDAERRVAAQSKQRLEQIRAERKEEYLKPVTPQSPLLMPPAAGPSVSEEFVVAPLDDEEAVLVKTAPPQVKQKTAPSSTKVTPPRADTKANSIAESMKDCELKAQAAIDTATDMVVAADELVAAAKEEVEEVKALHVVTANEQQAILKTMEKHAKQFDHTGKLIGEDLEFTKYAMPVPGTQWNLPAKVSSHSARQAIAENLGYLFKAAFYESVDNASEKLESQMAKINARVKVAAMDAKVRAVDAWLLADVARAGFEEVLNDALGEASVELAEIVEKHKSRSNVTKIVLESDMQSSSFSFSEDWSNSEEEEEDDEEDHIQFFNDQSPPTSLINELYSTALVFDHRVRPAWEDVKSAYLSATIEEVDYKTTKTVARMCASGSKAIAVLNFAYDCVVNTYTKVTENDNISNHLWDYFEADRADMVFTTIHTRMCKKDTRNVSSQAYSGMQQTVECIGKPRLRVHCRAGLFYSSRRGRATTSYYKSALPFVRDEMKHSVLGYSRYHKLAVSLNVLLQANDNNTLYSDKEHADFKRHMINQTHGQRALVPGLFRQLETGSDSTDASLNLVNDIRIGDHNSSSLGKYKAPVSLKY